MFRFICKEVLIDKKAISDYNSKSLISTISPYLCYLQTQSLKTKSESEWKNVEVFKRSQGLFINDKVAERTKGTFIPITEVENSPIVKYLVKSLKFSKENKFSKTSFEKFSDKSLEEVKAVVEMFRKQGFTNANIRLFVGNCPSILLVNPEERLVPVIEYFKNEGLKVPDIVTMVHKQPRILLRDLENVIIPAMNCLRSFIPGKVKILNLLKTHPIMIEKENLEELMKPSLLILEKYDVPRSNISNLLMFMPYALTNKPDLLEKYLLKAVNLGLDLGSKGLMSVIGVMRRQTELQWEQKVGVYKSYEMTDEEFLYAFVKNPNIMTISEKSIKDHMEFFVNVLGWSTSLVAKHPSALLLSLEKRIIPRCAVLQTILEKGVLEEDVSVPVFLSLSEKRFSKILTKYKRVPNIVKAYKGKIEFKGFDE